METSPLAEKLDVLAKMLVAQEKFRPARAPGDSGAALCRGLSPFVAERRRWFVDWEVSVFFSSSIAGFARPRPCVFIITL